jgi:hypothetical protein
MGAGGKETYRFSYEETLGEKSLDSIQQSIVLNRQSSASGFFCVVSQVYNHAFPDFQQSCFQIRKRKTLFL